MVRRATTREAVVSGPHLPQCGRQATAKPQCDQSGECGVEMPSIVVCTSRSAAAAEGFR